MKLVIISILITQLFYSCSYKAPKPENLISEEKMVDIIYDVSILNAAKSSNKKLLEDKGVFPEDYIFLKYNIDSLQLVSSLNYYANDVEAIDHIYTQVAKKINIKKESLDFGNKDSDAKKNQSIKSQSKVSLSLDDLRELSEEPGINIVGLTTQSTDLEVNEKKVFKLSKYQSVSSAYAVLSDVNIDNGDIVEVSIFVEKTKNQNALGLRISGLYPNRVDAIFDLNKGEVKGTNAVGYFENEISSIKVIDDNWYECRMKVKANIDKVKIIFGPTDINKTIGVWEGKLEISTAINTSIPTITIN